MILSEPQRISGEAFAIERLGRNPDLDYATLRAEAAQAGISMQPIQYGRARKHLGLAALRDARPAQAAAPAAAADPAAPAAERPAAARKGSVPFEFLVNELRREPALAYAELRDRAAAKGFTIAPIMYGRAKAVLGLVPVRPRGTKAAEKAARAATATVAPQLKQIESAAADRFASKLDGVRSVEQLVAVVKELDAERRRLRSVLERVVLLIDEALDA